MKQKKPLYIIGAGGFGREVAWLVERMNAVSPIWDFKGFLDDDSKLWHTSVDGYNVHGGHEILKTFESDVWCVFAVGNPQIRKKGINRLASYAHVHFPVLIDPDAKVSDKVSIGEGAIICAGSIITVDIAIGKHNIINLDCTVGHDAVLADYVTLNPSVDISGSVQIGECTEVGVGSRIIQGLSIGEDVMIGAGSGVFKDVEDHVTVWGNPARVMKRNGK